MIKKAKERISLMIKTVISAVFCLFPIKKNKIVMESFGGKNFSDNPKMIALEIVKENKPWDLVWLSVEKPDDLPEKIRWVKYGSIKALYEWGTARVWIDNIRHQIRPIKRRRQYYIQTWHGSFSLKCIEKDAEDKLDKDYIRFAKRDGKRIDAIVSSCKLYDDIYKRAFWLNNHAEILKTGSPRNDILFKMINNRQIRQMIRDDLGISANTFVVLYAPTFRDDRSVAGYIDTFEKIIKAFEERFGKNCCVLIRMHPNVSNQGSYYQSCNSLIDVSNYADVQELAMATDCVISDYSSIMFDYVFMKKPVFICALDIEKYSKTRGLLPIVHELPWRFNQSKEEVVSDILSYSEERYENQMRDFLKNYPFYDDGNAARRIVSKIQSVVG